MSNNMTVFSFCGNEVRTIRQDEQIFFVGKDVCQRLGYVNHTDAINTHCRGVAIYYPIVDSIGRKMTREHLKWTEAGRRAIIELWNSRNANR